MKAGFAVLAVGLMALSSTMGGQVREPQKVRADVATSPTSDVGPAHARELLNKYCVGCHNKRTKAGSLILEAAEADTARVGEDAEMWEKVVRKVRGGVMPPVGMPRPDKSSYDAFAGWLENELDSAAALHPNPGRTETFRRLNRAEYQNAIRDLLALDVDVSAFVPADDAAFGFDNIGGVFRLSPALMESYLSAAKRISRMAMGTPPSVMDEGQVYNLPRLVQQHDQMDGLGLGTRGGLLVSHLFPQNGEYSFRIDLNYIAIIEDEHTMELTVDGVQAKTMKVVRIGSPRNTLLFGEKDVVMEVRVPVPAGPHQIGVTFYRNPPSLPETLREPFQINTASNFGGNTNAGPTVPLPAVKALTIGGPYGPTGAGDTPSRRRILTCTPTTPAQEAACAKTIISTLARRAYRRPVSEADLKPLVAFYEDSRKAGDKFEPAIERVLRRVLASPEFIFRKEAEPSSAAAVSTAPTKVAAVGDGNGPKAYRISDVDLASRLSFFIWSSIPDDRLLDLAAQGRLKDRAVLAREVRRMLADRRSETLTVNFASQWLQLRKLDLARPGAEYGKNFDGNLKDGLRRETEMFFDSIVRDDRPATDLLDADYTFLNERVAQHYGIRDVQGTHFRRVALPAGSPRRGLLGKGSILTLTSQGIRTSPVSRGKYILEILMGTPPPEPPPDVPALPEGKAGSKPKNMRERMAAHRANPVCASCHNVIDPLGFSLENFDPAGAWRDLDEGLQPVDASGVLPDGAKFNGVDDLRSLLMRRPEQLVTTMTEKMMTYALGRGLEAYDMPAVRKAVKDAAPDYRMQSIVLEIVNSYPFQMRSTSPAAPAAVTASR